MEAVNNTGINIQGAVMNVLEDIIKSIEHRDATVTGLARGEKWTAITSRGCGLGDSMKSNTFTDDEKAAEQNRVISMSAVEAARFSLSGKISDASLGMAAINSLIECDPGKCSSMDGLQIVLGMAEDKNVSIIGRFPYPEELAEKAKRLRVMENPPMEGELPFESAKEFLPDSDIIIMSSTTLIDHNFQWMMDLCRKGSVKMFLGPGTPMTEVLYDHGLDILSGSIVTDAEVLMKAVSEGADFRQIRKTGCVQFVTMSRIW